jgi:hypothetical protein
MAHKRGVWVIIGVDRGMGTEMAQAAPAIGEG